jgi:hypothetical protein
VEILQLPCSRQYCPANIPQLNSQCRNLSYFKTALFTTSWHGPHRKHFVSIVIVPTAALLRLCCLAMGMCLLSHCLKMALVYLPIPQSLHSNSYTCYNIFWRYSKKLFFFWFKYFKDYQPTYNWLVYSPEPLSLSVRPPHSSSDCFLTRSTKITKNKISIQLNSMKATNPSKR